MQHYAISFYPFFPQLDMQFIVVELSMDGGQWELICTIRNPKLKKSGIFRLLFLNYDFFLKPKISLDYSLAANTKLFELLRI